MRHSLFCCRGVFLGCVCVDKARDGMEDCAIGQNEEGKDLEDRRGAAMEARKVGHWPTMGVNCAKIYAVQHILNEKCANLHKILQKFAQKFGGSEKWPYLCSAKRK